MILSDKLARGKGLHFNAVAIIIGLCVGAVLNIFFYGISSKAVNWPNVATNFMFSIFISLGVANSVWLSEYLFSKSLKFFWVKFIGYYGGSLIGVTIGHELSQLIIALIYHVPYRFLYFIDSLEMSLTICLIVSTIMFAYHMQRERYNSMLSNQELEVIKLKQLKTQAELQTLQSKINPHFLYNSLNSIASLIHENADKAEDMTLKLSKLFRYSINTQNENLASIREEIEVLKTYLDIEIVRFGQRMEFIFDVDPTLMEHTIPRFLLQPLVENSLKHGLANVLDEGKISVSVKKNDDRLEIKISDNGIPFPGELAPGYGLESTYEKLALLYPDKYEVEIANTPEKFICIRIPA